jgi:hypothetical protein
MPYFNLQFSAGGGKPETFSFTVPTVRLKYRPMHPAL